MVKQIHIFLTNLREIVFSFNLHRLCLYPMAIFPVRTVRRHFTQIDLRIKIGGKRIAMVAAIAVENINCLDLIKIMFQCISGKDTGDTRIKAASEKCRDACFFKLFLISPLPGIVKICRKSGLFAAFFIDFTPLFVIGIFRLIIGGINIIHLACQTRIHDRQILIRQCHIQNGIRLIRLDQCDQFFHMICIHLCCCDLCFRCILQFFFQVITLCLCSAGNADFRKCFAVLTAFVDRNSCNSAASDDQ